MVDDDVIEAQFAKWFKDYVRVVISSYYIVEDIHYVPEYSCAWGEILV